MINSFRLFFARVRAIKSVKQCYNSSDELLHLLEQFRSMLNESLRIGLTDNLTSMKSLSLKTYKQLSPYDVMSYYKLCAISKAAGILRNYRKAKRKGKRVQEPYARKNQLVTCYGLKIKNGELFLPFKPREFIRIPLNKHTISTLAEFNVRSVTLTPRTVIISFSKETAEIDLAGYVGIDCNLENITVADTEGSVDRYDLSEIDHIKQVYREIKSKTKRNNTRIRQKISGKYGVKERNNIQQILHHASKQIVMNAKTKQHGIAMEKLKGIRRLYRKGNGQGSDYRFRLNSWSYAELQRQVEYKARWEGIPVIYVNPHGTSAKCSMCGREMKPEENRKLKCATCGFIADRDLNAARNILARGMRFVPVAPQSEAMVREPAEAAIPQSIVVS